LDAPKVILALCTTAAALIGLGYLPAQGAWLLIAVGVLHSAALAPLPPLSDTLALGAAAPTGSGGAVIHYGWLRGCGSAAFALGLVLSGQVIGHFGIVVIVAMPRMPKISLSHFASWGSCLSSPIERQLNRSPGRSQVFIQYGSKVVRYRRCRSLRSIQMVSRTAVSREEGKDRGWHRPCFAWLVDDIRAKSGDHTRHRVRWSVAPIRGAGMSSPGFVTVTGVGSEGGMG
jgi:hypothetical protein